MALQEVKSRTSAQYVVDGFLFIIYGNDMNKKEVAGVGFVVDIRCRSAVIGTFGYTTRVATLKL
eukprot:14749269-Alexandrium_andersonii.AAC.1